MDFANEFLSMVREMLTRAGRRQEFPEHLLEEIAAALNDPARRDDMVLQVLRLVTVELHDGDVRQTRMVNGRLLYTPRGSHLYVWGSDVVVCEDGFCIIDGPRVIGGKPCVIERSRDLRQERVNWAGTSDVLYPENAISDLQECGGAPCYAVNFLEGEAEVRVGFVVANGMPGTRYQYVQYLCVADNRPAYAASAERIDRFVWGTTEVTRADHVGRPVVHDGIPHVNLTRREPNRECEFWRGTELLLGGLSDYHGLSVVRGMLAMGYRTADASVVRLGDEERSFPEIHQWWTPSYRRDNAFLVFTLWDGGVYVNFTRIADRRAETNAISLEHDGVTLRVRFQGEREARSFNLRELGILPAEPAPAT